MRIATCGDIVSPDDLLARIRRRYPALVLTTTWGARALRYNPGDALGDGVEFVTVQEGNHADDAPSMLARIGAYRVSFGVTPERYHALFGAPGWSAASDQAIAAGAHDASADTIRPDPSHAWLSWVTVVNPSPDTVDRLWPLFDEAYAIAVRAHANR